MAPLVHYVVIRRDMAFGEFAAQLAHAGEAYALRRDAEKEARGALDERAMETMRFDETTCIVKGARNEGRLLKLEQKLLTLGVPHVAIREEEGEKGGRIAGQLTCLSLMPSSDETLRRLLNDFINISGLDDPERKQREDGEARLTEQAAMRIRAPHGTAEELFGFAKIEFEEILKGLDPKTEIGQRAFHEGCAALRGLMVLSRLGDMLGLNSSGSKDQAGNCPAEHGVSNAEVTGSIPVSGSNIEKPA